MSFSIGFEIITNGIRACLVRRLLGCASVVFSVGVGSSGSRFNFKRSSEASKSRFLVESEIGFHSASRLVEVGDRLSVLGRCRSVLGLGSEIDRLIIGGVWFVCDCLGFSKIRS